MAKRNLSAKVIRHLRATEKFMIAEPSRFNMRYGLWDSETVPDMLAQPPCGTACCIAGSAHVVATKLTLDHSKVSWDIIKIGLSKAGFDMDSEFFDKLFFIRSIHGSRSDSWPDFYEKMYLAAKTPLERACVGVARIEHFIATDGLE